MAHTRMNCNCPYKYGGKGGRGSKDKGSAREKGGRGRPDKRRVRVRKGEGQNWPEDIIKIEKREICRRNDQFGSQLGPGGHPAGPSP